MYQYAIPVIDFSAFETEKESIGRQIKKACLKVNPAMSSIIDLIGNKPLVKLTRLNPNPNVEVYAKLEGNNPGGSVKDRAALNMIRRAIELGEIRPGTKLIEALKR